ncbi:MAG TPA: tyrosine-type recombinase/integrase [Candidatus Thermoplasmatota archaeon]|nr:tyrosine-type recombinase/integrase [Candidatus Thermoplasmatota archaeon]
MRALAAASPTAPDPPKTAATHGDDDDEAARHVKGHVPACKSRSYILAQLARVPHPGNRLWMAKHIVHCHEAKTGRGGRQRPTSSVYRQHHGITMYLEALAQTPIEAATGNHFMRLWNKAMVAPTRTFEHCQKGPLTPRTRTQYQSCCKRFLAWALGPAQASQKAPFLATTEGDLDPVTRIYTWQQIADVQADLSGMNLAFYVLLHSTGLTAGEIVKLPVGCITFEGPMAVIRVPPSHGFPDGRLVPMHHGDEILAAYQDNLRRDNPAQQYLFAQRKHPDLPMTNIDWQVRVRKWGTRNGIELDADRIRLTYLLHLLARRDVSEYYLMHLMGQLKPDGVKRLRRYVDTALQAGHDFGQPLEPNGVSRAGYHPCVHCGFKANPIGHEACGKCGRPLNGSPTRKATHILADLASLVGQLRDITGQTRQDRAQAALDSLGGTPA